MEIILYIILFLVVWTIGGLWWFLTHMGDKFRKEVWWEQILMAPVIPIACIVGWLGRDR